MSGRLLPLAPPVSLHVGTPRYIDDDGRFSAIWKAPVAGPVHIGYGGLAGDQQADRRAHGGPEKAVHHYAGDNYARIAAALPQFADALTVGSIGENISTFGIDEATVCIGDVFRLGSAVLQVSQPRRPCWKIDARYGASGVLRYVVDSGRSGWYYRVLAEGTAASGDSFIHLERPAGAVSLLQLWECWLEHRPDPARLAAIAAAPGLTPAWVERIKRRLAWLAANPA